MAMEADWEVEVGPGAPIIDAHWAGFVDLRQHAAPELVQGLPEVVQLPDLGIALLRINGPGSPVWTTKCDVWPVLDLREIDTDEMDAPAEHGAHAWACYIDLLPRSGEHRAVPEWIVPAMAVPWCKSLCKRLRDIPLRGCRVDLTVRRVAGAPDGTDIGITAYLTSCGSTNEDAKEALQRALGGFVNAFCIAATVE